MRSVENLTDQQLMEEHMLLHDAVMVRECFSNSDPVRMVECEVELENRNYKKVVKVSWQKET